MEPLYKSKFTLPPGDYIDTAWIPELLAQARWPDVKGVRKVDHFWIKKNDNIFWGVDPLTEEQEATLREVWQGLPLPIQKPIDVSDWQPYADAFQKAYEAGILPSNWSLECHVDDPELANRIRRENQKREYQTAVAAAIQDGSLQVRTKEGRMPVPPPASGSRALVVTRESLKEFAERVGGFEVADTQDQSSAKSKGLRDDAKQTYLRIIRALAMMAPLDLDDNATKRVEGKLIELGFHKADKQSDPGAEAIRKTLVAARALAPDYTPER